jgi:hypothetical protein
LDYLMSWGDERDEPVEVRREAERARDASLTIELGGVESALLDTLALRTGLSRAQVVRVALLRLAAPHGRH